MARQYSNTSKSMRLLASVTAVGTTLTVDDATGLPSTFPYNVVVDPDTSLVEVMSVTSSSGNTLTVTRGQQDTPASAHAVNAVVYHAWTALDGQEAQTHYAATGNVHGVGATANVVGTDTTQVLTNKTISGASNTLTSLPAGQVTGTLKTVVAEGATAANVAVTAQAVSGQTADIQQWKDQSGVARTRVNSSGQLVLGATLHADASGSTINGNVAVNGSLSITGTASTIRAVTTDDFLVSRVTGDSVDRLAIDADGTINLGPGNAARDTHLYRASVGTLETDGDFTALGDVYVGGGATVEGHLQVNDTLTATGAVTGASFTTAGNAEALDFLISGSPDISLKTPITLSNSSAITLSSGWAFGSADLKVYGGKVVYLALGVQRTGGDISSGSTPNVTDTTVGTIPSQYAPPSGLRLVGATTSFPFVFRVDASGVVVLEAFSAPSLTLVNLSHIHCGVTWIIP